MHVYDLSKEAVETMLPVDLTALTQPPSSPIDEFPFNDATCGIGCFVGLPPWECHTEGDEFLHVLAGEAELTTVDDSGAQSVNLGPGSVVVVPRGCWHRNSAPGGVTMLYITPMAGTRHSWAEEPPQD
jgi:mannose-6-phosphate isomerase-like protein (cupin superfamily)